MTRYFKGQKPIPKRYPVSLIILSLGLLGLIFSLGLKQLLLPSNQASQPNPTTAPSITPSQAAVAVAVSTPTPDPTPLPSTTPTPQNAQQQLQAVVDQYPNLLISITFTNLDTGASVSINPQKVYTAASTTKVLAACLFLTGVDSGKYSLTQTMGSATAKEHLTRMVQQSNNTSWDLFNRLTTFLGQEKFARSIGISSYVANQNSLSAPDFALLLTKLYQGELLSTASQALLLSLMQNTNEEKLLGGGLPAGATLYHKYGILDDNLHDGGIITYQGHTYVLSVYTNGKGFLNYNARLPVFHAIESAALSSNL